MPLCLALAQKASFASTARSAPLGLHVQAACGIIRGAVITSTASAQSLQPRRRTTPFSTALMWRRSRVCGVVQRQDASWHAQELLFKLLDSDFLITVAGIQILQPQQQALRSRSTVLSAVLSRNRLHILIVQISRDQRPVHTFSHLFALKFAAQALCERVHVCL